jgi:hypothetical protein
MDYAPAGQPTSTVLDIHSIPGCYGPAGDCDQVNPPSVETTQAQTFFDDFWTLMTYRQITGYTAMFGERPSNQQGCDQSTSHTVLRPWENVTVSCYVIPANVGAPSGPYAR